MRTKSTVLGSGLDWQEIKGSPEDYRTTKAGVDNMDEKEKIEGLIQTILQARDLLRKGMAEGTIGELSYLYGDIQNGTAAVNQAVAGKYGICPEFNVAKQMEEIECYNKSNSAADEISKWVEQIHKIVDCPASENGERQVDSLSAAAPIDKRFSRLMKFLQDTPYSNVRQTIKEGLYRLKKEQRQAYISSVDYYNKYQLWGKIQPEKGVYELVDNRAHALKEHAVDFEWLYTRLCDSRSKKILCNILTYWLTFDFTQIGGIVDRTFSQYFDLDLIACSPDEVFVDIGAYIGDTLADYVNTFGRDCYKRYYCYEILPSNLRKIRGLADANGLKNIVVCGRGAGEKADEMFTTDVDMSSVGQLDKKGSIKVPVVAIDEDIKEAVTFIKMDIEGAEEGALRGCLETIRRCHPKLSLSVYHNHKDMWKLARMIYEADPTYHFYLRYYGGNLCPTEYLLYAV